MTNGFSVARLPRIEFGYGVLGKLPALIKQYTSPVLFVTGSHAFVQSQAWLDLLHEMHINVIAYGHCQVNSEPSPIWVDEVVRAHSDINYNAVIGIGGGSVMDAAKAIAGLLKVKRSVMDYLEGVGPELEYLGPAIPFIAVPTTAGTGSEATRNAVLSKRGKEGFKKSFRHDKLVAEYAFIDPSLLASCPPELIAASGMDALTQLLESYVSLKANPFTDALAISGLHAVKESLLAWYKNGAAEKKAMSNMAYVALVSGITLAQVGLGSVHGLAAPLGVFFPIPHGVACGTLVASATEMNIRAMQEQEVDHPALGRYAKIAEVLCGCHFADQETAFYALILLLQNWTEQMKLPSLSAQGISESDFDLIIANCRGSSMKTNPIVLSDKQIRNILKTRL